MKNTFLKLIDNAEEKLNNKNIMKNRRRIQLDVKDIPGMEEFKKLNISVDGNVYGAFLPVGKYKMMLRDGVFIRDGKTTDSANVRNTTETFYSEEREEVTV